MLPLVHRLKARDLFATAFEQGSRYRGETLRLWVRRTADSGQPTQIGLVVSKKVSKKAVVRNRIKRQLRAIFRQHLPRLQSGLHIVAVVSVCRGIPMYRELCEDVEKLLIAAGAFHANSGRSHF